jgi:ribose-phosphate pyrophosphokinase
MMVFAGSVSKNLGGEIADALGVPLGLSQTSKFTNDELRVYVGEKKVPARAIIVQSLSAPVDSAIIEFCLMADALHRMGVGDITAVIPWLGYSKQDKVFRPGEPLSVKVIAKILQVVPLKRIITFDLHNLAILGFFDVPLVSISARPMFVEYFVKKVTPNTVVVAPDAGSIKSSTAFAEALDVPVAYMDKKRDLTTGNVEVKGISRPVDGADVIIIDDMIVTGSTMVETAKYLRGMSVKSLSVCATHHLYVSGAQRDLEGSGFDDVVVSNTIEPAEKSGKLTVLSVAGLIAEELKSLDQK